MSHSGGRRAHRDRERTSSCRAWAGGLDDDAVAELRRRVDEDAVAIVALLFAHAEEWDTAERPPLRARGHSRS